MEHPSSTAAEAALGSPEILALALLALVLAAALVVISNHARRTSNQWRAIVSALLDHNGYLQHNLAHLARSMSTPLNPDTEQYVPPPPPPGGRSRRWGNDNSYTSTDESDEEVEVGAE